MGLFDKIKQGAKDITGLGLSAAEQYARAYEKGVFLQPPNYRSAVDNFEKAAEKFTKDGNAEMARRATANAVLYQLVSTGDRSLLLKAAEALNGLTEIERIGNQQEMLPTAPLITELAVLQGEAEAEAAGTNEAKAEGYRKASDDLLGLGNAELQFASKLNLPGPTDNGSRRAYYYRGMSCWNSAIVAMDESPDSSLDHLHQSLSLFRQAQQPDWEKSLEEYVEDAGMRRHCWMCDREVQGRNVYFKHYPASSSSAKYFNTLVGSLKHDEKMLEKKGYITLCTACGNAIEEQADAYALKRMNELKEWVVPILQNHDRQLADQAIAINECIAAIRRLEASSHRH